MNTWIELKPKGSGGRRLREWSGSRSQGGNCSSRAGCSNGLNDSPRKTPIHKKKTLCQGLFHPQHLTQQNENNRFRVPTLIATGRTHVWCTCAFSRLLGRYFTRTSPIHRPVSQPQQSLLGEIHLDTESVGSDCSTFTFRWNLGYFLSPLTLACSGPFMVRLSLTLAYTPLSEHIINTV